VYVCLCNAYRESQVCDAIRKSTSDSVTVEELYARLGSKPRCGQCVIYVNELMKANRAEQMVPADAWAAGRAEAAGGSGSYPFSSPDSI
jgi:bacterioferritin-associated ferredoxin